MAITRCYKCKNYLTTCICTPSESNKDNYMNGETPTYYTGKFKGIKAIDVIYDFELEHNEASALEYILRAGKKDDRIQDLKKAINHLQMKIEHLNDI